MDRGTAAERWIHKGAKRLHLLPIDTQILGLEVMALRQYRHT